MFSIPISCWRGSWRETGPRRGLGGDLGAGAWVGAWRPGARGRVGIVAAQAPGVRPAWGPLARLVRHLGADTCYW